MINDAYHHSLSHQSQRCLLHMGNSKTIDSESILIQTRRSNCEVDRQEMNEEKCCEYSSNCQEQEEQ